MKCNEIIRIYYLARKWTRPLSVCPRMSFYQIRYSRPGLIFGGMTIMSYFKPVPSSLLTLVVHGRDWNLDYGYKIIQQILKASSWQIGKATTTTKATKIHFFTDEQQLRKVSRLI